VVGWRGNEVMQAISEGSIASDVNLNVTMH
jgi:hypothetical protein